MNDATRDRLAYRIRQSTKKVLIVGGRSSNWTDSQRKNPRVLFWDTEDLTPQRVRFLPKEVGFVFLTRWIRHAVSEHIKALKGPGVEVYSITGTGQIKSLVFAEPKLPRKEEEETDSRAETKNPPEAKEEEVGVVEEEEEEQKTHMQHNARGSVKRFVEQNVSPNVWNSVQEETDRLLPLANELGMDMNQKSLAIAIYRWRKRNTVSGGGSDAANDRKESARRSLFDFDDEVGKQPPPPPQPPEPEEETPAAVPESLEKTPSPVESNNNNNGTHKAGDSIQSLRETMELGLLEIESVRCDLELSTSQADALRARVAALEAENDMLRRKIKEGGRIKLGRREVDL